MTLLNKEASKSEVFSIETISIFRVKKEVLVSIGYSISTGSHNGNSAAKLVGH